ncbi:MAG TPA: CDP-alcohol phosphatidyltransferase family protein [Mycobacteriales bacterium]|nr:CDP-alcohol phosphatidyltransferase family protein [Mycobacteriales bacterium]
MGLLGLTWLAMGAAAGCLLVVTVTGVRRPDRPPPDQAGYLREWSALHGGYDPSASAVTGRWLALVRAVARPLASRGVAPGAVTCWGLWAAAAVAAGAAGPGRWPLLGVPAVVASGLLDSLDGAVAVLSGRASRFGYLLDSLADRCADSGYVLALFLAGAPGWLCLAGGGLAAAQEYVRARAGNAGMGEIGVVSVWERPGRVLVTAFALLGAGAFPAVAGTAAAAGAAAWVALGTVGCGQVLRAAHTALLPH